MESTLLQLASPHLMAENWPDWAISVASAGVDSIRIHEGILNNKVDCLISPEPKMVYVLVRSINPVISSWDVMHVVGGWARSSIRSHCKQVHEELCKFAKDKGCNTLLYNWDSYFLQRLIKLAGAEVYTCLNLL